MRPRNQPRHHAQTIPDLLPLPGHAFRRVSLGCRWSVSAVPALPGRFRSLPGLLPRFTLLVFRSHVLPALTALVWAAASAPVRVSAHGAFVETGFSIQVDHFGIPLSALPIGGSPSASWSVNQPASPHNLPQGPASVRGRAGLHHDHHHGDVNGLYRDCVTAAKASVGRF